MTGKTTLERALELARNGTCRTIDDLCDALRSESRDDVDEHMGTMIVRQLQSLMARAND